MSVYVYEPFFTSTSVTRYIAIVLLIIRDNTVSLRSLTSSRELFRLVKGRRGTGRRTSVSEWASE